MLKMQTKYRRSWLRQLTVGLLRHLGWGHGPDPHISAPAKFALPSQGCPVAIKLCGALFLVLLMLNPSGCSSTRVSGTGAPSGAKSLPTMMQPGSRTAADIKAITKAITEGMSRDQVIAAAGEPDSSKPTAHGETLEYHAAADQQIGCRVGIQQGQVSAVMSSYSEPGG